MKLGPIKHTIMETTVTERCPVPTPGERHVIDASRRAEGLLHSRVAAALEAAVRQAAEELAAVGQAERAPRIGYFAFAAYQRLSCLLCGADVDTLKGGDPVVAGHLIRNAENIVKELWSAEGSESGSVATSAVD